jgi:hypothetical protein
MKLNSPNKVYSLKKVYVYEKRNELADDGGVESVGIKAVRRMKWYWRGWSRS